MLILAHNLIYCPKGDYSMSQEIWKDVIGCINTDIKQVSNLGNVRKASGIPVKLTDNVDGYLRFPCYHISKNGKKSMWKNVHQAVAECFIPNPLSLPEVGHKTENNKHNNGVDNLEWTTHKKNMKHYFNDSFSQKRNDSISKSMSGEKCYKAKLSNDDVNDILRDYIPGNTRYIKVGPSYVELASKYHVTPATIINVVKGRTYIRKVG